MSLLFLHLESLLHILNFTFVVTFEKQHKHVDELFTEAK